MGNLDDLLEWRADIMTTYLQSMHDLYLRGLGDLTEGMCHSEHEELYVHRMFNREFARVVGREITQLDVRLSCAVMWELLTHPRVGVVRDRLVGKTAPDPRFPAILVVRNKFQPDYQGWPMFSVNFLVSDRVMVAHKPPPGRSIVGRFDFLTIPGTLPERAAILSRGKLNARQELVSHGDGEVQAPGLDDLTLYLAWDTQFKVGGVHVSPEVAVELLEGRVSEAFSRRMDM